MKKLATFQDVSSKFRQQVVIGGRTLDIYISWNARADAWYMNVSDITGDLDEPETIYGIRLVPNWMLLRQYRAHLSQFDGDLFIKQSDSSVAGTEITYDNLNSGWDLMYVEPDEFEAWEDYYGVG